MKEIQNIKWCAIQPLTGGMYIGTEKSIGHPAEFILSFPGIGNPKVDKKTGEINNCGNEYHLMKYLDKVGRRPEYKVINRQMFCADEDMNPEIINSDLWTINKDKELDYSNIDLVVAVPVCSGLSTATTCGQDGKDTRNCNMLWISRYALRVIKPKIYIFENAPTFMGVRGEPIRIQLEKVAKENGYSIVYYKTDTMFHDNCQSRKRTFIIFFKKDFAPKMDFEHIEVNFKDYMNRIPSEYKYNGSELDFMPINCINYFLIEYLKTIFGDEYKEKVNWNIFRYVNDNWLWDDVLDYCNKNYDGSKYLDNLNKFINHLKLNFSQNRGIFHALPYLIKNDGTAPAVMYKMIQSCIHPDEQRLLNIRELLHLMGMPFDFELQGNPYRVYPQIGQNVPSRTAYWIVSEALRAYERDNDLENKNTVRFFDNIKQSEINYEHLV